MLLDIFIFFSFLDLMAANQVLAMDAKSLLDVVDKARSYKFEQSLEEENRRKGESSSTHEEA